MRYTLAFAVLFAVLGSASAQEAETPAALSSVYACADLNDNAQRLACYDAAVGHLRQAETQGQVVAVDRQRVNELQRESFGFSLPTLSRLLPHNDRSEDLASQEMQIERITTAANGRARFVMANGQVWVQVETRSTRNVHPGDMITIRRASLGSFMLQPPRSGAALRVRREQ